SLIWRVTMTYARMLRLFLVDSRADPCRVMVRGQRNVWRCFVVGWTEVTTRNTRLDVPDLGQRATSTPGFLTCPSRAQAARPGTGPRSKTSPVLRWILDPASGRRADGGYGAWPADRRDGARHLRGLDALRGPRGLKMVREIVDGHDALQEAPRINHRDPMDLLRLHPVLGYPQLVGGLDSDQPARHRLADVQFAELFPLDVRVHRNVPVSDDRGHSPIEPEDREGADVVLPHLRRGLSERVLGATGLDLLAHDVFDAHGCPPHLDNTQRAASAEPGWSDNAAFCLARDAQPGEYGGSLARGLCSEHLRKFVDPDDPSSPLTILRRPCAPDVHRAGASIDQLLCAARSAGASLAWCGGREQAMKIVVIGGSGLIGTKLVNRLRSGKNEVVAASLDSGVNIITGEGLPAALAGAQVVVDVANSPTFEGRGALEFFENAGRNLVAAERSAGVQHHLALSIVGLERLPEVGYYRAKIAQ